MLAGKQKFFIVILKLSCFFYTQNLFSQFAPGPDQLNTSAIFRNDASISFWADSVFLKRSWQNISDTSIGKTTVGVAEDALGKSDAKFVSLGDAGEAILHFPFPIYNEIGNDFAVFENGFSQNGDEANFYFMELATVEVSENGIDFIAFESTSNIDTNVQVGSFSTTNCTKVNNLAGKYPLHYGTPFDLEELGLDSIISIKIVDVVGSINTLYASFDSQGNKINDPFPTPFPSSGFDLNAIAALNQKNKIIDTTLFISSRNETLNINFYPSSLKNGEYIYIKTENFEQKKLLIFNTLGEKVFTKRFTKNIKWQVNNLANGIYYLKVYENRSFFSSKFIVN